MPREPKTRIVVTGTQWEMIVEAVGDKSVTDSEYAEIFNTLSEAIFNGEVAIEDARP